MSESLSALFLQNPGLAIALRNRAYAENQMAQGSEGTPIKSPWQGLNRLAQGLIGGYQAGKNDQEIQANVDAGNAETADFQRAMAAALTGQGGQQAPQAPAPAPMPGAAAPMGGAYADRVIGAESGGNPNARNPNSTATGAGQFIDSTWLSLMRKNKPEFAGKSDQELLALRSDPMLSRQMVQRYGEENGAALGAAGLPVTDGTTYLAHWFGPGGATAILRAPPGTPMANVVPANVLQANPNIANLTTDAVAAMADRKMGGGQPQRQQYASLPPAATDAGSGPAEAPQAAPGGGAAPMPPQAPPAAAAPAGVSGGAFGPGGPMMDLYMRGIASNNPRVRQMAQGLAPFLKMDDEAKVLAPGAMLMDRRGNVLAHNTTDPTMNRITLNNDLRPANEYGTQVSKGLADRDVAYIDAARNAPEQIDTSNRIRALLDSGAITGPGADIRLGLAKGLNIVGANDGETIARTQNLVSELARVTQEHIKSSGLGGGSGFSNADRDFLERARAGTIQYTPEALKYLADLNERGARIAITNGNRALDRVRRIPGMAEYFGNQPAFSDTLPAQGGTAPPVTIAPPSVAPAPTATPAPQVPATPAPPPMVATPEDAKRLPPGTVFRTPDGQTLRVPRVPQR